MSWTPLCKRACCSGVLLGAATLPTPLAPLGAVALAPLLSSLVRGVALPEALGAGLLAGALGFGIALGFVPFASAGPALAPWVAYLVLVSFLAAGIGLFAVAVAALARADARLALAAAPGLWVGVEYARSQEWLLSFPWHHLGYALADWPALVQGASVFGLYGLSFWLAAVSAGLVLAPRVRGRTRALLLGALCAPLAPGLALGAHPAASADALRVAAVQPALADGLRHDPRRFARNLADLLGQSEAALAGGGDLVVWPESAYQRSVGEAGDAFLATLAHGLGVPILTGVWSAPERARPGWANGALLAGGDGRTTLAAEKVHPLPFYERAPQGRVLRALASLAKAPGRFVPGRALPPVAVPRRGAGAVPVGVLVCIDASYPELARRLREAGARLLVAVANEAATGPWSAAVHARMARLRAVEERVPVARVANTGPTLWIDAYGRVVARLAPGAAAGAASLSLAGPPPTFTRIGDAAVVALAIASAAAAGAAALVRRARLASSLPILPDLPDAPAGRGAGFPPGGLA